MVSGASNLLRTSVPDTPLKQKLIVRKPKVQLDEQTHGLGTKTQMLRKMKFIATISGQEAPPYPENVVSKKTTPIVARDVCSVRISLKAVLDIFP